MTNEGELLPDMWRKTLQENYTVFRDNLRPGELIAKLFSAFVITEGQRQELNAMRTDHQRTEFLINNVLRRGTKAKLVKFKEALKNTDQSHLIPYLPSENNSGPDNNVGTSANSEQSSRGAPMAAPTDDSMDYQVSQNIGNQPSAHHHSNHYSNQPQHPYSNQPMQYYSNQPQQYHSNQPLQLSLSHTQPYSMQESGGQPAMHESASVQSFHDLQPGGRRRYLRLPRRDALCVIFGFFVTDHKNGGDDHSLPGYKTDVTNLRAKFRRMDYDVKCHENLSKHAFITQLKGLQRELSSEKYDRFVLIILSHGAKSGVNTCSPDGRDFEYEQKSKVIVTYRDIIGYFLHNAVVALKDQPKYFIFQCCRGTNPLTTASPPDSSQPSSINYEPEIYGVEADVLVSFSAVDDTEAVVDHTKGSWFIQAFVRTLEWLDPTKDDIFAILTHVNDDLCIRKHPRPSSTPHYSSDVYRQTSTVYSALRKQFFLHDPQC